MTDEEKALEEAKKAAQEKIEKLATEKATEVAKTATEETKKAFDDKLAEITTKFDALSSGASTKEDVEKMSSDIKKEISELQAKLKAMRQTSNSSAKNASSEKVLLDAIKEGLSETSEKQKNFSGGPALTLIEKALSPASFGSAADYADLNSDRSLPLDRNPYSPVYLRNIFPNINTNRDNLVIWKVDAITGAAEIWKRGTGEGGATVSKPEVQPSWKKETVSIDWIPGITHVPKEMRDDVDFISTEVPYTLVYSEKGILAAENKLILDYIRVNKVDFSQNASYDIGLERVIAAAFGQIGSRYMTATHILINNWDYLTYFAFNKAGGSGEYNLPGLTVSFINGQMYINNLIAVPVPELALKESYVVATGRSRFVNRQSVELKISEEHGDNFVKNMLTYRAEERVGFFTYDNNSIVKVTLPDV